MTRLNKLSFILICATVIFTTLAYGAVHQPIIALFYALITLLTVFWMADSLLSGTASLSGNKLQIPLFLLAGYALIQSISFSTSGSDAAISLEPFATRVTSLHIFALCIFFSLMVSNVGSSERLRGFVNVITIFGFAYAFFAILQSVLSPDRIYGIYKPASATPFGSFVNRHDYAAIIEMAISLPLGLIFTGAVRVDKRLLYIVAIALMASSLLLSGSRGGLIALIAEMILLVILTARTKGRNNLVLKVVLSVVLVVAAVGGAIFVGGDTSLTRFSESVSADDISSSRTQIWGATIKVIYNNFPLGAGIGAFPQAYTRYDSTGGQLRVEQAHNDYLQIVADAGIVGLTIGILFLVLFFREGIRNAGGTNLFRKGVAAGAFAGCFAILVHSLFDFVLHITAISVMFLTLLGMLIASGRNFDDDTEEFETSKPKAAKPASVTSIEERSQAGKINPV